MSADFTSDQIVQGIETALHQGDVQMVPGLLRLLATKDPHRAADMLDAIELGIKISKEWPS